MDLYLGGPEGLPVPLVGNMLGPRKVALTSSDQDIMSGFLLLPLRASVSRQSERVMAGRNRL
jgi:hypothetical protein